MDIGHIPESDDCPYISFWLLAIKGVHIDFPLLRVWAYPWIIAIFPSI